MPNNTLSGETTVRIATLEWIVKLLYLYGAAVAAIALWAGRLQWRIMDLEKDAATHHASIQVLDATDKANQILFKGFQFGIQTNTEELKRREPFIDKANEMWFMKEHGVDNSQEYKDKHGVEPKSP